MLAVVVGWRCWRWLLVGGVGGGCWLGVLAVVVGWGCWRWLLVGRLWMEVKDTLKRGGGVYPSGYFLGVSLLRLSKDSCECFL